MVSSSLCLFLLCRKPSRKALSCCHWTCNHRPNCNFSLSLSSCLVSTLGFGSAAPTPMTNDSSIPPPPAPRTVSNHPGDEIGTTTTGDSRDTHLNTIDSIRVRLSKSLSVSTMPRNKRNDRQHTP